MGRLSEKDRIDLREVFNNAIAGCGSMHPDDTDNEREWRAELEKRVFAALDAPPDVEPNDPRVLAQVDVVAAHINHVRDVQEARKLAEVVAIAERLQKALDSETKLRREVDRKATAMLYQMRRDKHATRMGRAALRFLGEAGKAARK